jgi:hypothetical protein
MESTNLTTRTYTAPTCNLIVTTKAAPLPNLTQLKKPHPVDFTLQLGHPEQGESERIVLKGNPSQLDKLQQSVSQYVSELVAKFPLPNPDSSNQIAKSTDEPVSDRQQAKSGLVQNLPGLRTGSPRSASREATPMNPEPQTDTPTPSSPLSTKNISRLLGLRNSADSDRADQNVAPKAVQATPYLTGGDRSLDHKLHLGDLATTSSGAVLTLSAIQLFDLATTLDEYAAEVVTPKSAGLPPTATQVTTPVNPAPPTTTTSLKGIGASNPDSPQAPEPVAPASTPLSRLPNLPKTPAAPRLNNQVYDYANSGSRPAFLSVIPWAAAAALAVGVPFILFGAKSNSLKELTSSVKLPANVKLPNFKAPDFEAAKKSVMSQFPAQEPATSSPETSMTETTTTKNPKPWEQQPVIPPQTQASAKIPGAQMPTSPDKIGIAPLPPTVMDAAAQSAPDQAPRVTTGVKPAAISAKGVKTKPATIAGIPATTEGLTGIAPNPLNSPSLPPLETVAPSRIVQPTRSQISNPATSLPVSPAKIAAIQKTTKPTVTTINPGKVVAAKPIAIPSKKVVAAKPMSVPGKVAIATPIAMPPDLSVGINNTASFGTSVPFSPEIGVAHRVNPTSKPTGLKKIAKSKVKPSAVVAKAKAKTHKQTIPVLTPQQPNIEQFTQSSTPNPNIISPTPITSSEGANVQNPPAFSETRPQQNASRNPNVVDPFDNPSLKETKRFFQGKWQADPNQANSLQYVVRIGGKSGVVKSVNPQGEPATDYLKRTGMIKPGDKLVSPAAAGNNDQKIRVVLQPDGTVDAFGEP